MSTQTNIKPSARLVKANERAQYLSSLERKPFVSNGKLFTDTMAQVNQRISEIRAMNQPENVRDRFARLFNK